MNSKRPKDTGVRLLTPHSENCGAMRCVKEGSWKTPWSPCAPEYQWLNIHGTKNARSNHYYWFKFRCNCMDCPAEIIVNSEMLMRHIQSVESKA